MSDTSKKLSRRHLLRHSYCGFGLMGLAGLLAERGFGTEPADPMAPKKPHFAPRAKRVIFLFMHGGPSHLDTFDPKPLLDRDHGKPLPFKRPLTFAEGDTGSLLKSPWKFRQYGAKRNPGQRTVPQRGAARRRPVHPPLRGGRQCRARRRGPAVAYRVEYLYPAQHGLVGIYGLGTENQNLARLPHPETRPLAWRREELELRLPAGRLSGHRGRTRRDEHRRIWRADRTSEEQDAERRTAAVRAGHAPADEPAERRPRNHDPELEARIQAFELAFRMQTEAPEAFDISRESEATKKLYGLDRPETRDFGWQCLMARRLAERDVRFIQISHEYGPGNEVGWDAHSELIRLHTRTALQVDQPIAGLLTDLKARGLLTGYAGGVGRRIRTHADCPGRRRPRPQSVRLHDVDGRRRREGRHAYGATDDFGYYAVEDRMHIHDLHATILHILGMDHKRLTYLYGGRNFRLTDVSGEVALKILA